MALAIANLKLMIRRFLLLLIATYSILWFATGHVAKNHLQNLISGANSDNIAISYKSSTLSGYPFRLDVNLRDFSVSSVGDQGSSTLTSPSLIVNFKWLLSSLSVNLGHEITLTSSKNDHSNKYDLRATNDLIANIELNQSLFISSLTSHEQNSFLSGLKTITADSSFFRINKDGKMLLQLRRLKAQLNQRYPSANDNIKNCQIACEITTNSKDKLLNRNEISIDAEYVKKYTAEELLHQYSHKLNFNHLLIDNDIYKLDSSGFIEFHDMDLAQGVLRFKVSNISELENALKNSELKMLSPAFEAILEKAEIAGENANFGLELSPNSYKITKQSQENKRPRNHEYED